MAPFDLVSATLPFDELGEQIAPGDLLPLDRSTS